MDIDYDKLLLQIKALNSECRKNESKPVENFIEKMNEKYPLLKTKFNSIFTQCIDGKMNIEMITFMINKAKEVKKNKISNYDASVKIGEKLVEKFIKPELKKKNN